jgi:hypothetical protein
VTGYAVYMAFIPRKFNSIARRKAKFKSALHLSP